MSSSNQRRARPYHLVKHVAVLFVTLSLSVLSACARQSGPTDTQDLVGPTSGRSLIAPGGITSKAKEASATAAHLNSRTRQDITEPSGE